MPNQFDELIPNRKLAGRLGVTPRTLFQWTAQPDLNFPQPRIINARRYFCTAEIEAWQASRKPGAEPAGPAAPLPGIIAPIRKPSKRQADFSAIRKNAEEAAT